MAPPMRLFGYALPLPDVTGRFQRTLVACTSFKYLTSAIQNCLKCLIRKNHSHFKNTKQCIYLIPPSKKYTFIKKKKLKLLESSSYLLFSATTQLKPLLYDSLLTLSTVLKIFKVIAPGTSFLS